MTSDEFLHWAEQQTGEEKYELHDCYVVEKYGPTTMQAEKLAHVFAKQQAATALQNAADAAGLRCIALVDGASVKCDDTRTFIPDAVMQCNPIVDDQSLYLPDPIIVVEVLSRSTSAVDYGVKFRGYMALASIAHYLIIDLDAGVVIHHRMLQDHAMTTLHLEGVIAMDPLGIEIAVHDLLVSLQRHS